ncbi:MAG: RNA polymerase subunit sigma, partial [Streptomycetaceae bacterium]|nr:RNA polymerase subunit sigma [Streptomycetaceae bacterium]
PPEYAEPPRAPDPAPAPAPDSAPALAPVADLGAHREAKASRARRAGRVLAAAAAAAVLLIGGVAIGGGFDTDESTDSAHTMPTGPAGQIMLTGERHPANGAAQGTDGVTGVVALESKGWGSHVGLELRGVQGPLRCSLVAVGKNGEREVVGNWSVPAKGYGVASNPDPLTFHGGTSLPLDQLQEFQVNTFDGRTLVTVPV